MSQAAAPPSTFWRGRCSGLAITFTLQTETHDTTVNSIDTALIATLGQKINQLFEFEITMNFLSNS